MRAASDVSRHRRRAAGFTLIELLVALAIGLALVLAITIMLFRYEGGRRALTASNDASMGTAYAAYILDRTLRSAGSGFSQGAQGSFGCRLVVARSGTTVLPRSTAFPAPFSGVPITAALRMAPVIVFAGAGTGDSDVLAVMTGSSGLGETRLQVKSGTATTTSLRVASTLGLRANDLFLVNQDDAERNCMVQQAGAAYTGGASEQVDFGGSYANASIDTPTDSVQLTDFASSNWQPYLTPIGNIDQSRPLFQLIGIGPNATLMAYDLLQIDANPLVPIVDSVADLRVLYGVASATGNVVEDWVSPTGSEWGAAALLANDPGATGRLRRIVALRIGLLIRTNTPERDPAAPATLRLFGDLTGRAIDRTLTAEEQGLHWRTLDFTVPLRNPLLARCPSTPCPPIF